MASSSNPGQPPASAPQIPVAAKQNEYFVPRDGIDREVIVSDMCSYLGNDATVRLGTFESPDGKVIRGYYVTAYRNLTSAMVQGLKADSARWEQERRASSRTAASSRQSASSPQQRSGYTVQENRRTSASSRQSASSSQRQSDYIIWKNRQANPYRIGISPLGDPLSFSDPSALGYPSTSSVPDLYAYPTPPQAPGQQYGYPSTSSVPGPYAYPTPPPAPGQYDYPPTSSVPGPYAYPTPPPAPGQYDYSPGQYDYPPSTSVPSHPALATRPLFPRSPVAPPYLSRYDYPPSTSVPGHPALATRPFHPRSPVAPPNPGQSDQGSPAGTSGLSGHYYDPGPQMSTSDGNTTSMAPAGAATDSGYASMSHVPNKATLPPVVESGPNIGTIGPDLEIEQSVDENLFPENDTATVYSAADHLDDYHLNVYESELADGLANWVRMLQPDVTAKKTMADTLPDLLRNFALRLGQHSTTQSENSVMYFVHRYRHNIARRFREALLATANDEDASSKPQELVDKEKLRDSVQRWLENLTDEPSLVDDVPEAPPAKLDEQEMAAIPDEQKYREVAFKSPAYKWLLASLGKNAGLSTGSPDDATAVIRSQISKALPRAKAVSSKVASDVHAIAIRCDCDVETFVRHEYPDTAGEFKLGEVIAITGFPTDAQALTCLAYMEQTWPSTGGDVLSAVQRAFQSGKPASEELSDRTRITASAFDGSLTLEVEGTVDVITEMAEQIIWLAAALRSSEGDELTYCTPFIKQITNSEGKRQADVGFDLSVRELDQKPNGTCWHAMFRNPVVVRGYPIRRRPHDGVGLEVPLHIMAGLGQATHVTEFLGKSYIKGFASMFVAVDQTDGVCNWHHLYNSDGTRISYNEAGDTSAGQVPAHVLSTSRHIVGWCTKTSILAGSSNANYKVKRSGLPQAGRDFALDKISLSCGQMITGGATFSIGKKDVPIHVSKGGYVEKLRWITQRHVVLWDVEAKRGWMVDGATALHHLLRGSLEHSRTDSFRSEFLFDFSKLKDGSAIEVLLKPEHRRLLLYPSKEETHTETITGVDGETRTETKTKITYTTLGNKVEEIYTYLERMIEHKSQIENTKGFNAKVRLRRHLEGWDFSDLATNHDPSHLRVATLPASAFSWVELTRIAQAMTLFGKGFGDLLSPTTDSARNRCSSWGSVPTAKHYLCVRVADLQNIAEDSGGDILADPIHISPDLVWMNPSRDDPFGCVCDATQTLGKHPSPVQQLVPSSWRRIATGSSLSLIGIGDRAVIFGQGNGFQWTWPDGKGVMQPQSNITPDSPAGTTSSSANDSSSASHTSQSVAGASPLTPDTPMSSLSTQANMSVQSPQGKGTPELSTTSSSESSSPARSSPAPPRSDTATPERNKAEEEGTCAEPTNTVVGVKKGGILRRAWAISFWRR